MSSDNPESRTADTRSKPAKRSYACPDCGVEQDMPREPMHGGVLSGQHKCFCLWEDQAHGPLVLLATGLCCYRMGFGELTAHHRSNRRWKRSASPRAVDWDEVAACVASTRRPTGGVEPRAGWPEATADHVRVLSREHRAEHWPRGPSESFFQPEHRRHMAATADEIADWLMLARDHALHSAGSLLVGSADVHAAGELLGRLAEALASWDRWRADLIVEEAAHVRRILAAAAFRWGTSPSMFRLFVADHLDAGLAQRLGDKDIALLACAVHLRRRGRPKKEDDAVASYFKHTLGLAWDEKVPDKIEALQNLAASIGVPRISPDAVEDQVQPLLTRLVEIRREREEAFSDLQKGEFKSSEAAREAFEDADVYASVLEDEAIRSCGTRKKAARPGAKKQLKSRAGKNSRRTRSKSPPFSAPRKR